MRTLRKTIFRLLLLAVVAAVMAGCVLIGRGYQMYQAALTQQSLESKVEEIQSDSGYTGLSELPEMYLNAVVAVEDHRFEQHFGIDLIAIGRAAWNNLTTWSLREGGSTITQQLAKNMYFTQEKSFIRKVAEMFMAFRLERAYTKEEILELYVNSIYFGDGYYGIGDACEGYLSESPIEMTDYECTLMAGIPNAPSVYSLTENHHSILAFPHLCRNWDQAQITFHSLHLPKSVTTPSDTRKMRSAVWAMLWLCVIITMVCSYRCEASFSRAITSLVF